MKYIFTLITISTFFQLVAGQQTFTTLNPADEVYFVGGRTNMAGYGYVDNGLNEHPHDTSFHGYRIDSTHELGGGAVIYYFNKMKREALHQIPRTFYEMDCDSSHWLGDYMIKSQNYEIYHYGLFNFHPEIYYKTDAKPGETWTFSDFSSAIQATLDSHFVCDTVFGVLDTIYTIHLSNSDVNDPYEYDGRKIKVGKKSGFINTIDHYHFPFDSNFYNLCGVKDTSGERGITQPDYWDIYDFRVGDEFHYKHVEHYRYYSTEDTEQFVIDSVYEKDGIRYFVAKYPFCEGDSLVYRCRTIKTELNKSIKVMPYAQVNYQYYQNGDHIIYADCNTPNIFQEINDYYECAGCSSDGVNTDMVFQSGLGQLSYRWSDYHGGYYGPWSINDELVYYTNGDDVYGEPLDEIECFVSVAEIEDDRDVRVYPNPVLDLLRVESNVSMNEIHISTASGMALKSFQVHNSNFEEIDVSQFASGIYIVTICSKNGIFSEKIYKY